MRLLVRVFVVVASAAAAVAAWHYGHPKRDVPGTAKPSAAAPALATPRPIRASALAGTYQGPIQRADSGEEWLVLEITQIATTDDNHVTFDFTLSSSNETVRDQGQADLGERRIRFGGLSGEIRPRDDGQLSLRSAPIDGPPHWLLDPPRAGAASPAAGGTRP